jgi:hypothetical protein
MTAASLLLLLVVIASMAFVFRRALNKNSKPVADRPTDSPRQQLEFESGNMARELKIIQRQELKSYQWVDDKHQFAKIPISRAMEIYLRNQKAREQVAK